MNPVQNIAFKRWQTLPALSPAERENRPPTLRETGLGICRSASCKTQRLQTPSPLPGGEGHGEGERRTHSFPILATDDHD